MMQGLMSIFVAAILLSGCQSGMVQTSGRNVLDKEGSLYVNGRVPGQPTQPPEIFVRKKELQIQPIEKENDSGSLFNLEDERNYLYATRGPVAIGKYIDVQVASRRADAANPAAPAANQAANNNDAATNEILNALPELAPAENPENMLKRIQMRVVERLENGDVVVLARRSSQRGSIGSEISVKARIPYEKLASGEPVTTDHLADVHWVETDNGQLVERYSSNWEDEYTLRLSGFTEAKSKLASELDDKRKQLLDVRKRVETQAKTMGDERRKLAKEREALLKRQSEDATRIQQLEKEKEQQADKIKALGPAGKGGGGANLTGPAATNSNSADASGQRPNNDPKRGG